MAATKIAADTRCRTAVTPKGTSEGLAISMLKSELQDIIVEAGEGSKVEFKRDDVRPEQLARQIVSFANMNGGRILLGVEDDGTVSGARRANLQAWVMDTVIGRCVVPPPHISRGRLSGMTRSRFWDFPVEVIRELLVNAFAHRDWTRQNDTRLVVYHDRMEVTSPGALPNGMTIDKIKAGQQAPRNTHIVRILRDYGLMDDRGMGIPRKVIPLMRERNRTEPEFEATVDYFKVVLWKGSRQTRRSRRSVEPDSRNRGAIVRT